MKRRSLMALPLALFGAGFAQAQDSDRSVDRRTAAHRADRGDPHVPYGRNGRETHFDRGGDGWQSRDGRDNRDDRHHLDLAWQREARRGRYRGHRHPPRYARGAGPYRNYHPGGRLPDEYRLRHYVVDDWRDYGLSAPPRGYHWVQTGGDFVLVAIATGIILQLLLHD